MKTNNMEYEVMSREKICKGCIHEFENICEDATIDTDTFTCTDYVSQSSSKTPYEKLAKEDSS